ncbi:DUF418 domain-containing protein [Sphingomonas piscis]|uniref:DUF418 domain-containing protein n=1 Tax=Sphingomonas piscis TaxID=2714943 RepID=A0A6G7YR45_9SPHN|nr:DUF418 domain-containing protein [Sphingomonas piscis]QIK79211.1 DUF418 domain-containing protein [Sphingomonas piscis]
MAGQAERAAKDRIVTLDVTRGIAVMGIFSVNVVGMAMIQSAYFYPPAFGFDGLGDRIMWLLNFIFIDGKLRGLFSVMFGASILLVMDAARRAGRDPWKTHYARMLVLLGFGLLHFFVLWWGDILTHYAAVGMVVVLLSKLNAQRLFALSAVAFIAFAAPGVYFFNKEAQSYHHSLEPGAPPELKKKWAERMAGIRPDAKAISEDRAAHASIPAHFRAAQEKGPLAPLDLGPLWIETLGFMLLGMAGYKSGFLTGAWDDRRYCRVAILCFGGPLVIFAAFGAYAWQYGFAPIEFTMVNRIYAPPLRPIMAMGIAALIILMFREGSALRDRFAAVGRTAFSNYIACTLIGTFVFYGFGLDLYAQLSRGEAWLLVPPVWAFMLLWSKWWLERFHYGPLEWLWRSLSRLELQPLRRTTADRPMEVA